MMDAQNLAAAAAELLDAIASSPNIAAAWSGAMSDLAATAAAGAHALESIAVIGANAASHAANAAASTAANASASAADTAAADAAAVNYWPLLGVLVVIVGFALRLNPALVVLAAGFVTGATAGLSPLKVLDILGTSFTEKRFLLLFLIALPVIGLLERHGLKEHTQHWIARLRGATMTRLLVAYLFARQALAALGLTSVGGHPQTVRPLIAPMAESAAEAMHGPPTQDERERIRAMAAGTDNVGLFFGEDIFIAFGAVLLIQAFFADNGIALEPLHIALWGIPTAVCAFVIHSWRIRSFERRLAQAARARAEARAAASVSADADASASTHASARANGATEPAP